MRSQEVIMREAGYVTASAAAEAIGVDQVGTIHRMVSNGKLRGCQTGGKHWYVSVKSLLEAHADAPPLVARIKALGVDPKDDVPPVALKKGGRRRGRASA